MPGTTSPSLPPRDPAWHGTAHPAAPTFAHPVHAADADWLCQRALPAFAHGPCAVLGALAVYEAGKSPPHGHFLVRLNGDRHVAHVKQFAGPPGDLALAAALADYLAGQDLAVIPYRPTLAGCVEHRLDGAFLTMTPFFFGRHAEPKSADAAAIGHTLGTVHRALRQFPDPDPIRRRTDQVVTELTHLRDALRQHIPDDLPQKHHAAIAQAARDYDPAFECNSPPQCCHGDVSPGNVLIGENGTALLGDFEDAAFGFRPVLFDLAMATIRFALPGPAHGAAARATALLDAYTKAAKIHPDRQDLAFCARNICHHFTLVMAHLSLSGQTLAATEWAKPAQWRQRVEHHL